MDRPLSTVLSLVRVLGRPILHIFFVALHMKAHIHVCSLFGQLIQIFQFLLVLKLVVVQIGSKYTHPLKLEAVLSNRALCQDVPLSPIIEV